MAFIQHVTENQGAAEGFQRMEMAPLFPQRVNRLKVLNEKR
jgi:hypothetical protein